MVLVGAGNWHEHKIDGLQFALLTDQTTSLDTHLRLLARLNFGKTHGWRCSHYSCHYDPLKGQYIQAVRAGILSKLTQVEQFPVHLAEERLCLQASIYLNPSSANQI